MTPRQAQIGLALLASSGSFVTVNAIADHTGLTPESVPSAVSAVAHYLRSERNQMAFLEHKNGYGYVLYGVGHRLQKFEAECRDAINAAMERGSFAARQDAAAAAIMASRATPSSMIGMGA